MSTKSEAAKTAAASDDTPAADEPFIGVEPEAEDKLPLSAEERTARAEKIIQDHVLLGVASGLVPSPVIDVALAVGVQLTMLKRLSSLYGVPFRRNLAKGTVMALLNGIGGVGVGALTALSLVKTVPVLGTFFGIAGASVSLGAFTYATGKVFQQHFESGGTFIDLDPRAYRDYFRDMFRRGKDVASRRKKDAEAVSQDDLAEATSGQTVAGKA